MLSRKFALRGGADFELLRIVRREATRFLAPGNLAVLVVLAVSCFITGQFGNQMAVLKGGTAIWPPAGIALAAVLLRGNRVWPGIFIAIFFEHMASTGSISNSVAMGIVNTLEALVGAYLVNRFAGGVGAFYKVRDVLRFVFLAGMIAPALCATVGVSVLCQGGFSSWTDYWSTWLVWWVGDMLATVLLTPFLVLVFGHKHHSPDLSELFEATVLLIGLSIVCVMNFGPLVVAWIPSAGLLYLCLPFLAWAALRFCPLEAAGTTLLMGGFAIWGSVHGYGPYGNTTSAPLFVAGYVVVGCATTMTIAAAKVQQRKEVEEVLGMYYIQNELKDCEIRTLRDTVESLEHDALPASAKERE
jgi:integral membrane sensor domain MASE1